MTAIHRVPAGGDPTAVIDDLLESDRYANALVVVPSDRLAGAVRATDDTAREGTAITTWIARAERQLDRHGWTVPASVVHHGRTIPTTAGAPGQYRDWLAMFAEGHPEHRDRLATVDRASELVAVLERLVGDGILPDGDGFEPAARRRLLGQDDAFERRLEWMCDRVPSIDPAPLRTAVEADATKRLAVAHDALTSYLGWCLDTGRVTPTQRVAYGAAVADPINRPAIVVTGQHTTSAAVELGTTATDHDRALVTGAGRDWAWWPDPTTVAGHLLGRAGASVERIEVIDHEPTRASVELTTATEPDRTVLDVAERHAGSARRLAVRTPTAATARRLMRLGDDRAMALARSGPIDPFATAPAVLGLAWLRIVAGRQADRGWAVVLEHAGCTAGDIEAWLDTDDKPAALAAVRSDLKRLADGPAILGAVAQRYGLDHRATAALLDAVSGDHSTAVSPTDAIATIERGRGHTTRYLPAPTGRKTPVTTATSTTDWRPAIAVHRLEDPSESGAPLEYRPPLGLRWRETVIDRDGHPRSAADPHWATLAAVRDPPAVRAARSALETARWANDRTIVVGSPSQISVARRLFGAD